MTIKEIAELCGVDDTTILRWTRNISDCKMQSDVKRKLKKSGHGIASDFSLEETLVIIGDGGANKTLAALLEENSKNKNALSIASSGGGAVQILNKFNDRLERIENALESIRNGQLQISAQPEITDPKTAMLYFGAKFLEITGRDGDCIEVSILFKVFKSIFTVQLDNRKFMYELPLAFSDIRLDTRRKYKPLFRGCALR